MTAISAVDIEEFVLASTTLQHPPLVPEIGLWLGDDIEALWQHVQTHFADADLNPPFWAFAWAGGQGVARYVLDHVDEVAGRTVLDFATGSGLCAIAAALSGARSVCAVDIDPLCGHAVARNAALAGVDIAVQIQDLLDADPPPVDVLLAGDVWYDEPLAVRALPWLRAAHEQGTRVLLGDPGRHYLPQSGLTVITRYDVATPRALEGRESVRTTVSTFG
jgi:predicted nicotinamide N-methyase